MSPWGHVNIHMYVCTSTAEVSASTTDMCLNERSTLITLEGYDLVSYRSFRGIQQVTRTTGRDPSYLRLLKYSDETLRFLPCCFLTLRINIYFGLISWNRGEVILEMLISMREGHLRSAMY